MNQHEKLEKKLLANKQAKKFVFGYYEVRDLIEEYNELLENNNNLKSQLEETTKEDDNLKFNFTNDYIDGGNFSDEN